MEDRCFTIEPLEETHSWPAERFGEPWNGFATPVVTRETLADLLQSLGEGYRWEEDTAVVWSTIDLAPGQEPEEEDRLTPDSDGFYDLGELGWVFFTLPLD